MSALTMSYREAAPSPAVASVVFSFWEFTVRGKAESNESLIHKVFPDGCVSLFYYQGVQAQHYKLFISGLSLKSSEVKVFAGDIYWAMRISPAACHAFLRVSPATLQTQPAIFLPVLAHVARDIEEALNACEDFAEAILVFEKLIEAVEFDQTQIDHRLVSVVQFIEEIRAQTKVAAVAEFVGLSSRQLERLFFRASGLTPKQYLRARRIRATAIDLVENSNANWASRATEVGFTDQAHLTHELGALTNSSPNIFAENIQRIEHGSLIKK